MYDCVSGGGDVSAMQRHTRQQCNYHVYYIRPPSFRHRHRRLTDTSYWSRDTHRTGSGNDATDRGLPGRVRRYVMRIVPFSQTTIRVARALKSCRNISS